MSATSGWEVYMIQTQSGKLYTGISPDPARRLEEHQTSRRGARFFRISPAAEIVYRERHRNRSFAAKREAQIKAMSRQEKLEMIRRAASP